jgi:hypothetical protein
LEYVFLLLYLALVVVWIAGMWKAYEKAKEPGWAAIVPIYNAVVALRMAGKPEWWVILYFVPCVGLIVLIIAMLELAKAFGKGAGYGIGLVFLPFIFWPMLGWGDAEYIGPDGGQRSRRRSVGRFDEDEDEEDDRPRRRPDRDDDDDDRPRRR